MILLKLLLLLAIGLVIGFGFWYLIFWFLTAESNLFLWSPWIKVPYLFLAFSSAASTVKEIDIE